MCCADSFVKRRLDFFGGLPGPFSELRRIDQLGEFGEGRRRAEPSKLTDRFEQRRVASKRRELLEQHRQVVMIAECAVGDRLDVAEPLQNTRGFLRAEARNSWITIRSIADQREIVGNR